MPNSKDRAFPIIVVDDDEDHAMAVADMLGEFGWKCTVCLKGEEALQRAQELPNSLMLCDYNMPGMNGLDVLSHVDHTRTGFVMLTALANPETVAEALRNDCDDYTFKPVTDWAALDGKLCSVAARLASRVAARKEAHNLSQMADWQSWKATFLRKDIEDDMQELLKMLHVQFKQDVNFSHLLDLIDNATRVDPSQSMRVKVPIDVLQLLVSALRPMSKFFDGIEIASSILGDELEHSAVLIREWLDELNDVYVPRWRSWAEKSGHQFLFFADPDLHYLGAYWLEIDRAATFKAINELVVNAFKHSDSGSTVTINLNGRADRLSLTITNPPRELPSHLGKAEIIGLPREFENQAFRLFYRLNEEASATDFDEDWPMGLGLPLVRAVFLNAKGDIGIHNETWHLSGSLDPVIQVTARASLPVFSEQPTPN